jgi:hypothetical protein
MLTHIKKYKIPNSTNNQSIIVDLQRECKICAYDINGPIPLDGDLLDKETLEVFNTPYHEFCLIYQYYEELNQCEADKLVCFLLSMGGF